MTEESKTLFCNFCRKSQFEVLKLIAGPQVYICDECTDICIGIVLKEAEQSPGELKNMPNLQSLIRESQDKEN